MLSLFAFWMGGAGALGSTPPPVVVVRRSNDGGYGEYKSDLARYLDELKKKRKKLEAQEKKKVEELQGIQEKKIVQPKAGLPVSDYTALQAKIETTRNLIASIQQEISVLEDQIEEEEEYIVIMSLF